VKNQNKNKKKTVKYIDPLTGFKDFMMVYDFILKSLKFIPKAI
jgi:hypothetical protein